MVAVLSLKARGRAVAAGLRHPSSERLNYGTMSAAATWGTIAFTHIERLAGQPAEESP